MEARKWWYVFINHPRGAYIGKLHETREAIEEHWAREKLPYAIPRETDYEGDLIVYAPGRN